MTKLNAALKQAVADPQVHAGFERQGAETMYLPPDQAARFITGEIGNVTDIIVNAGIRQIE